MEQLRKIWVLAAVAAATALVLGYFASQKGPHIRLASMLKNEVQKRISVRVSPPTGSMPSPSSSTTYTDSSWAINVRKHILDPAAKDEVEQRERFKIHQRYGRLFAALNLDDAKRKGMEDLMVKDQIAQLLASLPYAASETKEQVTRRLADLQSLQLQETDDIGNYLGDAGAKLFHDYSVSYPFRDSIESTTDIMRANGFQVDDQTQANILEAYARVIETTSSEATLDATANQLATMSSQDLESLKEKENARFDEELATTMSSLLKPDQYQAFMTAELQNEMQRK
jgi:hypothetical protein